MKDKALKVFEKYANQMYDNVVLSNVAEKDKKAVYEILQNIRAGVTGKEPGKYHSLGGALIGTAIAPGIGTLIGALVGKKRNTNQTNAYVQDVTNSINSQLAPLGYAFDSYSGVIYKR